MPKYYRHKVYVYYLYFTTFCLVEAMHVHASDEQLTEDLSAEFFCQGRWLDGACQARQADGS